MGLYSEETDWAAGREFANVSMYFVALITLNTDTDTDTGGHGEMPSKVGRLGLLSIGG